MNYLTKLSIQKLARELDLPKEDEYTQDWEYEVADCDRIEEFIEYYQKHKLNQDEKIVLIKIILESYNDYVKCYGENIKYSKAIWNMMSVDTVIYLHIIDYWACEGDELEDSFAITPLIRKIKNDINY